MRGSWVAGQNFKMSFVGAFLSFHLSSTMLLLEIHLTLLMFVPVSLKCCRNFLAACRNLS